MVSLVKHQSVLLVCFNGSYIESCSSFMIHDFIQVYRLLFGIHVAFFQFWDPGDGGTPYNGSARKGHLFQASAIWKGRDFTCCSIWKGRKICHFSLWNAQKAEQMNFMDYKVGKTLYFCDWFLLKWQCIYSSSERDAKFLPRYVKGVPFVKKNYTKGLPFSRKMVYKRVRVGFHLGAEPPRVNICGVLRARKGKNFEKNNCPNA